ncbi:MAG: hypothetical protein AAF889_13245 [Cyanobacteria bacterium P01_D01_bin.73]
MRAVYKPAVEATESRLNLSELSGLEAIAPGAAAVKNTENSPTYSLTEKVKKSSLTGQQIIQCSPVLDR